MAKSTSQIVFDDKSINASLVFSDRQPIQEINDIMLDKLAERALKKQDAMLKEM